MKSILIFIVGIGLASTLPKESVLYDWIEFRKNQSKYFKSLNLSFEMPPFPNIQNDSSFGFLSAPVTRKEYRCLNSQERLKFEKAIQKTRDTIIGSLSQYETFATLHLVNIMGAHSGPNFLPWHRHYLYLFEQVLRTHCSDCAFPFWDSRLESRLNRNPQHSVLFSSHLAGNADGLVNSGFAANWTVIESCKYIHPTLFRSLDNNVKFLMDDEAVYLPSIITKMEQICEPWNETFEMNHNKIHMAFGIHSHMYNMCSPNDLMFLFHHSFIDNLFERARQNIKRKNSPLKYVDLNSLPQETLTENLKLHAENATMYPFNILNRDGLLDDSYTTLYYNYEKSPGDVTGCRSDSECCGNGYSKFVWCHKATGRCLSKVVSGGMVDSSFSFKACFCDDSSRVPIVISGRCACGYKSVKNIIKSLFGI